MGISIVLYRVSKAETLKEINDLENQMQKAKSVNLYKMTEDMAMIFLNTSDPYDNTDTIPYKALFGSYVEQRVGDRMVNGFVSSSEVKKIVAWIKEKKIDHFEGFSMMYDQLSIATKETLKEIGSPDKKELYKAYVEGFTKFYLQAMKEDNAILICGE